MPDRTGPIVFEVVHPVRSFHQRFALTAHRVGKPNAVGRSIITNFLSVIARGGAVTLDREYLNGIGNIFQDPRAKVAVPQREFFLNLIVDLPRNANSAGLRDTFETRSYVHTVAVNIVAFHDHIAQMHADAQNQRTVAGGICIAGSHFTLNFRRAIDGLDDAGEFRE